MAVTSQMESTVEALLFPGKGILAADESLPTIERRFKAQGVESTEVQRRAYREMLFTTAGLGEYISGAILFDETIRQRSTAGIPLQEVLASQGIIPGIKVDRGTVALPAFPGELVTEGLDGLRERLTEYRGLGARFTKWRAVVAIGDRMPTRACTKANARELAHFAALSQEAGLVPIVEPEILMNGNHSLTRSEEVATSLLKDVFDALVEYRVTLEHMLLKTSMIVSGSECPDQADDSAVAETTLRCLRRGVPVAVPGIVFLSGGQEDEVATKRLNAICQAGPAPWTLSFSFGRALQAASLGLWKGSSINVPAAQEALLHRARCNSAAVQGRYSTMMEHAQT